MRIYFFVLILLGLLPSASLAESDCQLNILHSAIGSTHSFNLEVTCAGNYNTLTYLLRSKTQKNGTTRIDSESGELHILGDSKTTGPIKLDMTAGDSVTVEARILQACEILADTTLHYSHEH